jgi:hypothetical protein
MFYLSFKDKLISERIRWFGYILIMNEERIVKEVLNMKLKGRCQTGRSRCEQQIRKDVTQKK